MEGPMPRVALYEDEPAVGFSPLTLLRPVFELRCGHFTPRERLLHGQSPAEWGAFLRCELQEIYREEQPAARVNDEAWLRRDLTLFINGRWLSEASSLQHADGDLVGICGEEIAWLLVDPDEAALIDPDNCHEGLARIARTRRPVIAGGAMLQYPWDLIAHNGEQIRRDHHLRNEPAAALPSDSQVAIQGPPGEVWIDPTASIDPFVVIDARNGPVWIGAGARVLAFTRIEGPCCIGEGTQLFRAHVRAGTSIGPHCRVGGEIEESLFHGYANKYHDGFLGHGYVSPWVNLGALTTNSDLKNDYAPVRVPLAGEPIDTHSTKVGCFIGDHTKTALGSLFNTGSSVGVMTMLLPGGELLPKFIPSFSRLWHGRLEALPDGIESSLQVARTAMARRNCTLTEAMERRLRAAYAETEAQRRKALAREAANPKVIPAPAPLRLLP
jgi:UDP-N-acetylglucosamine diphosphorylase/glucosamine-1-phosphate N-acetyltransferase